MHSSDTWRAARSATAESSEFGREVMTGLSASRKSLPCRFFYDEVGSELFEDITKTTEYYPTRAETAILEAHAREIAQETAGAVLVEFGSGSSRKTELLLERAPELAAYIPIDVSATALRSAVLRLAERFPRLRVMPLVGDFTQPMSIDVEFKDRPKVGFFPGSTIGNFAPEEASSLLRRMAQTLGSNARLIVGVDLKKDTRRLLAAYNDAAGVTAAFNLNLLARINRELGGTFDLQFFRHEAIYEPRPGRIEMYLISEREQAVEVMGRTFQFAANERIHTENSYKYSSRDFAALAQSAGWTARRMFLDDERLFALIDLAST